MLNKGGKMCAMTWYLTGYENTILFYNLCCHEKLATLSGRCMRNGKWSPLESELCWWCPEDNSKSWPSRSCHWSGSHKIAPGLVRVALPAGYKKYNLSFKGTVRIKPPGKICLSVLRNCLGFFSSFGFRFSFLLVFNFVLCFELACLFVCFFLIKSCYCAIILFLGCAWNRQLMPAVQEKNTWCLDF